MSRKKYICIPKKIREPAPIRQGLLPDLKDLPHRKLSTVPEEVNSMLRHRAGHFPAAAIPPGRRFRNLCPHLSRRQQHGFRSDGYPSLPTGTGRPFFTEALHGRPGAKIHSGFPDMSMVQTASRLSESIWLHERSFSADAHAHVNVPADGTFFFPSLRAGRHLKAFFPARQKKRRVAFPSGSSDQKFFSAGRHRLLFRSRPAFRRTENVPFFEGRYGGYA